jgi:hypothetical protein
MEIKELNISLNSFTDDKSTKIHTQFVDLLNELRKELPENIVRSLNLCVKKINSSTLADKQLSKFIKQEQTSIIKQIEKEIKLCQKLLSQSLVSSWNDCFWITNGAAIGLSLGNIGL